MLKAGKGRLSWIESLNLRLVRASFEPGFSDRMLRFFQRSVGQAWIHHSTKKLCRFVGIERLPQLREVPSVIIVTNHRSFFDLYVITAALVRRGMNKRIAFLVRSEFFYDSIFGLVVNFFMSFLAMYPPIFRDKKKAALNVLALDELSWLLARGGLFVGLHPEGRRKLDSDPYTFLPARAGVGRIIQEARVPVIPVFINGLSNDLFAQVKGNFNGKGKEVMVVFGEVIDFGESLDEHPSPRLHREISQHCLDAISKLGSEEKKLREKAGN